VSVEVKCDGCNKIIVKDAHYCDDCYTVMFEACNTYQQEAIERDVEIHNLVEEVKQLKAIVQACDRCTHHQALEKL